MGHGSWCICLPTMLLMTSVLPTWALDMMTTHSTLGSSAASIISRWYGARLVCHLPGSALVSLDRRRYSSAHWLVVRRGGGNHLLLSSRTRDRSEVCEFPESRFNFRKDDALNFSKGRHS